MKNLIFKILRWMAGMLGVTAAASCDSVDDLISAPEYGVPYAAFEVKCKVVDSVTGNPVKGVMMTPGFTYSYGNMSGFQQTGLSSEISDGVFEITGHQDIGADYNKLEVKLTDKDPATDGHYKDTVYVISLEKIKDADSGWCEGTYAADVTVEAEQVE